MLMEKSYVWKSRASRIVYEQTIKEENDYYSIGHRVKRLTLPGAACNLNAKPHVMAQDHLKKLTNIFLGQICSCDHIAS